MKKSLFIISFLLMTNTIIGQKSQSLEEYTGYVPSTIRETSKNRNFTDENGTSINPYKLKLSDFNIITTTVIVTDEDKNIGGFGIKFEKKAYQIIYSFENYIIAFDNLGTKYRIGASIEVIANIFVKKKRVNLSDLFSLAINAEKNKISGSLSLTAKGFNSDNIYGLFNIGSNIDRSSIQQILKNVGIMISKFSDKTIRLKPVILGYESKKNTL